MNLKIPVWAWAVLAALVYYISRGSKDSPSMLTGAGANLAALKKSEDSQSTAGVSIELDKLSAQASLLTAKVKENPSLGTALGFSPTQIDYIVLPPDQFRTTYGFTADPDPITP